MYFLNINNILYNLNKIISLTKQPVNLEKQTSISSSLTNIYTVKHSDLISHCGPLLVH